MSDTGQTYTLTTPEQKRAFLIERGWKGIATGFSGVPRMHHDEHGDMTVEAAYRSYLRVVEE